MEFRIGEKVVYPNHGVGVVEQVTSRSVNGTPEEFYMLRIRSNDSLVMVPTNNVGSVGLRKIIKKSDVNGLFNVGTGVDRSWNGLAAALFQAMGKPVAIEYIAMPESLRDRYQYYTRSQMDKLRAAGCLLQATPLEEAVHDYVVNYLQAEDPYL